MSRPKRVARRDAGRARGAPIVDAVLTHTLEELATSGLEGLSVERIARKAEVNKTSVYRRWPTRDALVAAALEGVLTQLSAQHIDTGTLRGDLLATLEPVALMLEQPLGRAVLRAAFAESSSSAVSAMASRLMAQQATNPVKAFVSRAKKRGEWSSKARGEQLVFMLVGAVMHRTMLEHQPVQGRWLHELVDLALQGVTPRNNG